MRRLRDLLRTVAELPRGHGADGRMLGMLTATAIESSRRRRHDRPVGLPVHPDPALPRQRQGAGER